jgi:tetratricopeptide (TPR) repeat protein
MGLRAPSRRSVRFAHLLTAAGLLCLAAACSAEIEPDRRDSPSLRGATGPVSTSKDDLEQSIARASARLAESPSDSAAAVALADSLLRQARLTGDATHAMRAEQALVRALTFDPDRYETKRMLAAVYLSQHRFREALQQANRCLASRPDDDWILGVVGDAYLELGSYTEGFDAIDRMNAVRPTAASYARASYARELQGDLEKATELMQMAIEATPASDREAVAWYRVQLALLWLGRGEPENATRELARAEHTFPGHPLARMAGVRVAHAEGRHADALRLLEARLRGPSVLPSDRALAGELLDRLGRTEEAARQYRLAEAAWRSEAPEPAQLARFLVDRGRAREALAIAEAEWADRKDVFTADALAWSHFALGHVEPAAVFIAQALRTGIRDVTIRAHAKTIATASQQHGIKTLTVTR